MGSHQRFGNRCRKAHWSQRLQNLGGMHAVPYWYSMHNIVLQMGLRGGLKAVIKDQSEPLADEVNLMVMPPPEMPPAWLPRKLILYCG